ncbi:MAG: helix-turn-helix domain-containing protein [Acidobacteriota bacterium]
MKTKFANPVEMIRRGAPRLIRNDDELEHYTEALFELTAIEEPSAVEIDAINLLSLLVETYEARRYSIEAASPLEVLRFLMDQNGLEQRDLTNELGSPSNVSLILAGKRNLTLSHIQRLSARFGVPAAAFVERVATAA